MRYTTFMVATGIINTLATTLLIIRFKNGGRFMRGAMMKARMATCARRYY